ncbi:cytochrome c oxidase assembly protein [Candidatus Solirubrobacter pratensis]|uniref:cytochrome c oxidase assembly protein n=1 Tax=Candidatus Solirubrobacter pratensis TaxID=1298857 RepID=UPI000685594D|nr:cytochrome c oxidase assembly protein [Candidatus Solirubrobacter pratensis]
MPVEAGWTFAPIVLIALVCYVAIYVWRWRISRAQGGARAAPVGRLVLWCTGVLCLFIALISPVDAIGEQLASVHMVQHLLIADLAPICLTLGLTKWILRPATRRIQRLEHAAGPFGHPAFGVIAYVGAMWLWHVPAMYNAALEHSVIHVLEHLSFGAAGLLYWWHLLSPIRSRMRLGGLGPILYMASTKVLVGFLGVLLAFSPTLLFDFYDVNGTRWGLSPIDDQHVAGLVMALEQSIVMGIALAYLFARMLAESEAEDQRAERYGEREEEAAPPAERYGAV